MKEMNRREFLMASAAASATLMAGSMLKGGPSVAYASVQIPEVEKLTITVITDNYYDCLRWPDRIAKRSTVVVPGLALHAEHGLIYYIETVLNGKTNTFMFDFGWDFQGVSRNLQLLGIDLTKVDALGVSHGHLDHFGNLIMLLKSNQARIKKGIPIYVGEETFSRRYIKWPPVYAPLSGITDLGQLNRDDLEGTKMVEVVEVKEPTPIVPGAYLTGNIERVTDYEKGSPILFIKRGGKLVNDLFPGEQSVVFNVKGKGLVVLSSCAHAGIVNTVKHAQKMTGIDKVHAVMGGFHLIGAPPEKIRKTVADIKAINPDYIVPMHCSGWEAITLFEREMPKQFVLNMAGTRYEITA
jgi:7,8-dihydropterin-6-yl-methyl-4-(beta-D-ribofuranosyl)aminobenzene 5'-phosphate synthase